MTVLSWDQLAALALRAGWKPADAAVAVSITEPESGRDDSAIQANQPYATTGWGLWQITPGDSEPQFGIDNAMLNPWNNARAAYAKWSEHDDFGPWTTWTKGLNQPYLPDAEEAVAKVAKLSKAQLARLVDDLPAGHASGTVPDAGVTDWSAQVRKTAGHTAGITIKAHNGRQTLAKAASRQPKITVHVPAPGTVLDNPRRVRGY